MDICNILAARNGDFSWLLIMVVIIIINAISSAAKQKKAKQAKSERNTAFQQQPKTQLSPTIQQRMQSLQQSYQTSQQTVEQQIQTAYQQQLEARRIMAARQRREMGIRAKKAQRLRRRDEILAKRQERLEQARAEKSRWELLARRQIIQQEVQETQNVVDIYNLNSQDMQSAVILSEILSPPIALR